MTYHALVQTPRDPVLKELAASGSVGADPSPFAHLIHGTIRGWVLSQGFPCNGAKSAINTYSYRLGIYDDFTDSANQLGSELQQYVNEYSSINPLAPKARPGETIPLKKDIATFLACFKEQPVCDESTFETQLW